MLSKAWPRSPLSPSVLVTSLVVSELEGSSGADKVSRHVDNSWRTSTPNRSVGITNDFKLNTRVAVMLPKHVVAAETLPAAWLSAMPTLLLLLSS